MQRQREFQLPRLLYTPPKAQAARRRDRRAADDAHVRRVVPPRDAALPQRLERRAELAGEEFRLFPCREVTTFVDLVEVGELAITALGPTSWRLVDFSGEDRDGDRQRDLRRLLLHAVEVVGVV